MLESNTSVYSDFVPVDNGSTNAYDGLDDDTINFLKLAGIGSDGNYSDDLWAHVDKPISNGSTSPGTVSNNSAILDPQVESPTPNLDNNKFDFSELLKLYNEAVEKQYSYNAEQAKLDRDWQEYLSNTRYQRAFEDMKTIGLNPLVALGSLSPADTPSGASASGSYASISPLSSSLVSFLTSKVNLSGSLISTLGKLLGTLAMIFI